MSSRFIVTNFAYGTGPYLRTTELAIAFNDELEKRGKERMRVVIPLVYGERQRRVMAEEFSEHDRHYPGELLLDPVLGEILRSIFYSTATYEQSFLRWIGGAAAASSRAREHLGGQFTVETLGGQKETVNGKNIAVELNRSPRTSYGIAESYSATFAFTGEILDRARREPKGTFSVRPELFEQGVKIADGIEDVQRMACVTYPATFSYEPGYAPRQDAILIPPTMKPIEKIADVPAMKPGIYVTVTGIPGLERLYREAKELGLTLYSNDQESVPGSIHALPKVITNPAIKLHFARSGWSSVWASIFAASPLVVPDFDPTDDPEIYFNNRAVEKLGIGTVYRGETLSELLASAETVCVRERTMAEEIRTRFGTIEGTRVAAKRFANDFLR